MTHHDDAVRHSCTTCNRRGSPKNESRWLFWSNMIIGFLALVWFVFRVGTKPSRLRYPCQRVAAPLASGFLLYLCGAAASCIAYKKYRMLARKMGRVAAITCLCLAAFVAVAIVGVRVKSALGMATPVHTHPPMGTGTPRVVAVINPNVSTWTTQSDYWNYVNQSVVNTMMSTAITQATNTSTTNLAWQTILPDYSSGKKIAIKINYNNNDPLVLNSIPQPIVALINQLKQFGFPESNIYVCDASRPVRSSNTSSIHYFFRDTITTNFPGVTIIDNGTSGRWSTNQFSTTSSTVGTVSTRYAKILDDTDYLINVPIMRAHGISGVTFGFKNHYGSIEQIIFGGGAPLHDGITSSHSGYSETGVPLVELNSLSVIKNKTVLIVGDGIYSHSWSNTDPPNRNPEVIFMSRDPVALDSVMFDYFHGISTRSVWQQHYLHVAANNGLGVHQHYPYGQITYIEITQSDGGNNPPNAVASAAPTSGTVPLPVNFSGTGSSDSDGTIVSYQWNFGDGYTGSGATTSHTYTSAGNFVATLTVQDNDGATDTDTVNIQVTAVNIPPHAVASAAPTSGTVPLPVNFSGTASSDSDGTIVSYQWNFGDGATGSGATTSHTYTSAGNFVATLTVRDDDNATDTDTVNIQVTPPNIPPNAVASAVPASGTAPLLVNFSGTASSDSDGTIVSYQWNFGDGNTGTAVTTSHTYNSPGTYISTLTVRDDDNATDSDTVMVTANPAPQPGDRDGDGLSDDDEANLYGTDPDDADTDDDLLIDSLEVLTYHTNPFNPDTDGDGLWDGDEVTIYATSPTDRDSDDDGLTDGQEVLQYHTNPLNPDTDGDGYSDSEDQFPLDPNAWRVPALEPYGAWIALFASLIVGASVLRRKRRAPCVQ